MKTLAFAIGLCILAVGAMGILVPRSLRVVALIPLLAGVGALAVPLTAIPLMALGGFIAYACQPARRAL